MVKNILKAGFCVMMIAGAAGLAVAHTPLCSCYDGGEGTVICEGGFSDGASATGVEVKVVDEEGKMIVKGRMDDFSEFVFDKPQGPYKVIFDAGPGHEIEIRGKNIAE